MLITRKDVAHLLGIVTDLRSGLLPVHLSSVVLAAFFSENPHLLMVEQFDEHMQQPVPFSTAWALSCSYGSVWEGIRYPDLNPPLLPSLDFRTPSGRWASLISVPAMEAELKDYSEEDLFFSYGFRRALKLAPQLEDASDDEFEKLSDEMRDIADAEGLSVTLENLISNLESRVTHPRDATSVLWTPKIWTPGEQARQQALIDSSLSPHLERWKLAGICFEDLNPSEFEDLVGEVLLSAGLKVYKVRHAPQGGRDLIARGTLIDGEEPVEMAVEVKHRAVVDRPEVQLAVYQNQAYPALLFVTSGRFTAGVFQEKAREGNRFRLFLKDGLAVGDLVRAHFRLKNRSVLEKANRPLRRQDGARPLTDG